MTDSEAQKSGTRPEGENSGAVTLLRRVGHALVPILLAAGGLIGFVALAGSAIVWTRFSAAEIPADQVVAVYPRGELVAIASALLLLFGLVAVLAVIMFYLIEPKGRATLGTSRGLLALLGVEGLTVIWFIVKAESLQQRLLAAGLFVLCLIGCAWITFLHERPELAEGGDDEPRLRALREGFKRMLAVTLTATIAISGAIAFFIGTDAWLAVAALLSVAGVPSLWLAYQLWDGTSRPPRGGITRFQLPFTRRGMAWIVGLVGAGVLLPSIIFTNIWLWISLAVAAILITALWRTAVLSRGSFVWFGLAVFVSVPLFGTLTWMIQNVAEPQVQPMALIRNTDGPGEYLQGLYVTETDSRIYFATVSTQGCSNDVVAGSGRLLWVPKSEVAAMAIGPPQSVSHAREQALEMSYALAPSAAAPMGDQVSLTLDERRSQATAGDRGDPQQRRMEAVRAAVQPRFGAGLRLTPEIAAPGQVVTLRMTAPSEDTRGFGRSRHHRTLRLGGIPVDVIKEQARSPWEAEYIETADGRALKLGKQIVYTRHNGSYETISRHDDINGRPLYVRVSDRSVASVDDGELADASYLRLKRRAGSGVRLAQPENNPIRITVRGERPALVEPVLLRQAWHEDHIKFRVPADAQTGPITIECSQLASAPLMRIAQPPEARIAVTTRPGSVRVLFDSGSSRDENGPIVSQHWSIQGLDGGRSTAITRNLPPSSDSYTVRLTVTDTDGQTDSAQVRVLRMGRELAPDGKLDKQQRNAVQAMLAARRGAVGEPPAAIEIDAHPPAAINAQETNDLEMAERIRRALTSSSAVRASSAVTSPEGLVIRTLQFSPSCPAEPASPRGRIDIFVLTQGAEMVSANRCPPVRANTKHSLLVPR